MKNKFISLVATVCASTVLLGCGGGGDSVASDAADKYVGTWKSQCFSYVANSGLTRYTTLTKIGAKINATSFSWSGQAGNAYADSSCTNLVATGVYTVSPVTVNLGSAVNFAGLPSEAMVYTTPSATYPGFAAVSGSLLYMVTYDPNTALPAGWGIASPYIRQ